ncbi:hypothetical protein [Mesorhizobium sp. M0633]|uniref:hypothetical protein n=1 Tax=Mesorhizobium sp. M0633 TaxID=2956977 RepID=UPI0033361CED
MAGQRASAARLSTVSAKLIAGDTLLEVATESMLTCWQVLWEEYRKLHKLLVPLVGREELCRR